MTWRWPTAALLATGLLLVGCGDDDASSRREDRPSTTTTEQAAVDDDGDPSGDGLTEASGGGPGMENIGVGERVTVRVLDEDGQVVVGGSP